MLSAALVAALGQPVPASAAESDQGPWALCPPSTMEEPLPAEAEQPGEKNRTILKADEARTEGPNTARFLGNVEVLRSGRRLRADEAQYNKSTDEVKVTGDVTFQAPEATFQADRARMNLSQDSGELENTRYHIRGVHAFGKAARIEFKDSRKTHLEDATYSTCPPQKQDWRLKASTIDLDRTTNTGEAWNVTLAFKGLPFMYMPYMNFPLQGRKSGLLAPVYTASERAGYDLSVPYYWNIAPNRDATITPRYIEKRGLMAMTEFRYLNRFSSGKLTYDFLQNDALYKDELQSSTGVPNGTNPEKNDRYFVTLNHQQQFTDRWTSSLQYQKVSDPLYFQDFRGSINNTSVTHLERHLDFNYNNGPWNFLGRAQDYQALVGGTEPYRRMPQLLLSSNPAEQPGQLNYTFSGEAVNFDHNTKRPVGTRLDVYPTLSFPLEGAAWFVTPKAGVRYTQYDLQYDTPTAAPDGVTQPTRSLPIYSLDSGLFFERQFSLGGRALTQTLEPRLYYLYVPYRNQQDLPLFDTGPMTFSFAQLFRENRFTGPDRIGDADQITSALTTRFLDDHSGQELGHASIGQISYLKNRRVTLNGVPETRADSDLVGELGANPTPEINLSLSGRWNPKGQYGQEWSARVGYRKSDIKQVTAAYQLSQAGAISNTDLLAIWPVARRWHFLGRWYYDRVEERSLETVVGLEYESCCWSIRVAGRARPFQNVDGTIQSDRSIYLTLQLKGLGGLGPSLDSLIRQGILGYR